MTTTSPTDIPDLITEIPPELYAVDARTFVRIPFVDSARHRASSQVGTQAVKMRYVR